MKVTINSGNFAVSVEGSVRVRFNSVDSTNSKEEVAMAEKDQELVECGIIYILQRDGMSAAYKAILPKDSKSKRSEVPYSVENAGLVQAAVEKALEPYGEFLAEVGEYVPTTPAEMKDALAQAEGAIKTGKGVAWAIKIGERCGYEVATPTDAKSLALGIIKFDKFLLAEAKKNNRLD